jgi:hypothetical protein
MHRDSQRLSLIIILGMSRKAYVERALEKFKMHVHLMQQPY